MSRHVSGVVHVLSLARMLLETSANMIEMAASGDQLKPTALQRMKQVILLGICRELLGLIPLLHDARCADTGVTACFPPRSATSRPRHHSFRPRVGGGDRPLAAAGVSSVTEPISQPRTQRRCE